MNSNRKVLIGATLTVTILISSFVLVWGNKVSNGYLILYGLILIQLILILFLGIDMIKNKKNK